MGVLISFARLPIGLGCKYLWSRILIADDFLIEPYFSKLGGLAIELLLSILIINQVLFGSVKISFFFGIFSGESFPTCPASMSHMAFMFHLWQCTQMVDGQRWIKSGENESKHISLPFEIQCFDALPRKLQYSESDCVHQQYVTQGFESLWRYA